MSFSVEWSKAATKQLLSIPKKQRLIILSWVQEHLDGCEDPRRAPNGKQLQGTDFGWRWRVHRRRLSPEQKRRAAGSRGAHARGGADAVR